VKITSSKSNHPIEEPEPDFLDPSDSELGLVPVPEVITQPAGETPITGTVPSQGTSSVDVVLQLGLGIVLLGINNIGARLRDKQPLVEVSAVPEEPLAHLDEDQNQLRYALIGLILKTPGVISRGISRTAQMAETGYTRLSGLFKPLTNNRAARPINKRYEQMVARGERIVGDWIDIGRRGEITSQKLLQQTTDEVLGEVVDVVAKRPEITDLVQQSSMGMVDELTDELQGRASAVDSILERIVFKLIPGSDKDITPTLIIPASEEEQQTKSNKQAAKGRS
jgi:hypothetical protein